MTNGPIGAVLCGGRSRRMGTDKAVLVVDGQPMAELVARALEAGGCRDVVLVGGDELALTAATGRRWVPDRWPDEGPLGGLLTALAVAEGADVVVAACDLPDLDAATVAALITAAGDDDDVVAVVASTDRPHLLAWWRAAARPLVQAVFDDGERGIRRALRRLPVREVIVAEGPLRNVNEPGDLARATPTLGELAGAGGYLGRMAVPEIDIEEFAQRHAEGVRIVDVREPDEYIGGHVSGAVSVPLATVADRAGEIGPGDGPLYLICQAGSRSRRAGDHLADAGYDVVNVDGGTGAWIASGRDVVGGDQPT